MGKAKQRFNKKEAVRFTLVPGFDENGKPITHFRPVENRKSKVNAKQREKIIMQISDQVYDQIQINGRTVGENQIPAFVLQQIKGRKDLVFNQKMQGFSTDNKEQMMGDLYQITDSKDYDEYDDLDSEEQEWIDQEDIIGEDLNEDDEQDEDGEWEQNDDDMMEQQAIDLDDNDGDKNKKPFKLNQEEFPVLSKVTIEGEQYQLTETQIKLLDVLIPQNYENFQIEGLKFEKYDQNGLPLSQKAQYEQFLATGNQGIVDSFDYMPQTPTPILDTDLKPSQIKGELKEIQDALNYDGEEGAYQELEDDFFTKLIKAQIEANTNKKKTKKAKSNKAIWKQINQQSQKQKTVELPKILQTSKEQPNIFAKYDQLDEDILEQQITDEMLDKAIDDFQMNLEPKQATIIPRNNIDAQQYEEQQMEEHNLKSTVSMSFSELQKCPELIGKDGELDWRCLTRREKKEYMKTKIIRSFFDELREREIQDKLKGKKNISPQQLHLKSLVDHLSYEEDHVLRRALEEHAKEEVDLDQSSSYESESDQEDIVEYHQRTSVISSNLNEIKEQSKRKLKKKKPQDHDGQKQLDELSQTLSKLKQASQKRNRNETKEQRKARKEKQKELKKDKKEVKKQFIEKFTEQRRKHMKMNKPVDPLHKISYVKII